MRNPFNFETERFEFDSEFDEEVAQKILSRKKHIARKNFPDPNNCWQPGSTSKPDWSKTIFAVEAELEIPPDCEGFIKLKTTLRDVEPMGAAAWAEVIRFGVSDGTNAGGLDQFTRVSEKDGIVDFEKKIPLNGRTCSAGSDVFVYVKFPADGKYTFIEVGYYPRIIFSKGTFADNSPSPAIRLNPCNNLKPIRSVYKPDKMSQQYWKLPNTERKKVNQETGRRFQQETAITRKLNWDAPKDRPLARQWLRVRDEVIEERTKGPL